MAVLVGEMAPQRATFSPWVAPQSRRLHRVTLQDTISHDQVIPTQRAQAIFENGSKAGINAAHAAKLARQLSRLNVATGDSDMNVPGWGLHALQGMNRPGN